jgi:hypothetical protein
MCDLSDCKRAKWEAAVPEQISKNGKSSRGAEDGAQEKTCFVICPIGPPDSEIRKRSDQLLRYIISPVAAAHGYANVVRADKIAEPGVITNDIIEYLDKADLVVADLTGHNPNVFYELAVRHMLRKPVVQIIAAGEKIPFDVAAARTIPVDYRDLDSVEACKAELSGQIGAVEADPSKVDNPISIAFDLQALTRSGDPEKQALATVLEAIQNVGRRLELIEQNDAVPANMPRRSLRQGRDRHVVFDDNSPRARPLVAWMLAELARDGELPCTMETVATKLMLQGFDVIRSNSLLSILNEFEQEGRIARSHRSDMGDSVRTITAINPSLEEIYINQGLATG